VEIPDGLMGVDEIIMDPSANLKTSDRVKTKTQQG